MLRFDNFGLYGRQFTEFWADFWTKFREHWPRFASQYEISQSFDNAIRQAWTPTNFWYGRLAYLSNREGFAVTPADDLLGFWRVFRKLFNPCLEAQPNDALHRVSECLALCQYSVQTLYSGVQPRRVALDSMCYGPYTDEQMTYLLSFPNIWEVGAGSGYLVNVLRNRGNNAYGCDANTYDIMDSHPWTGELEAAGHLKRGGPELVPEDCSNTTLLISWPEPGARFVVEAMRLFREHGGKNMVLKLGGYVGRYQPSARLRVSYRPDHDAGRNIEAFFLELAENWEAPATPPPYERELFWNNVWAFRVREQPFDVMHAVAEFRASALSRRPDPAKALKKSKRANTKRKRT
ncbi:MAG: hypothetical protein U0136_22100 [Bdellovibrionota bacterium]